MKFKDIDVMNIGEARLPVRTISRGNRAIEGKPARPFYLVGTRLPGTALGLLVECSTGRLIDSDAIRVAGYLGVTASEVRTEVERVAREHGPTHAPA